MLGNSNKQWHQRAKNVTPGNHSNMAPYAFADGPVIAKGRGAHVWDVEDNEYIDFTIGSGPGILGYGNRDYIEAVKNQLDQLPYLTVSSFRSTAEIELAEAIVELVPCAEKVRFCLSGTEAVQLAIRLARAYTGFRWMPLVCIPMRSQRTANLRWNVP